MYACISIHVNAQKLNQQGNTAVSKANFKLTSFLAVFVDGNFCSSTSSKFVSKLSPALLITHKHTSTHTHTHTITDCL